MKMSLKKSSMKGCDMTDIVRTRVYAVVRGMELVDGDFMNAEHVIDGRATSVERYVRKAKRLYPRFLPREVRVMSQKVRMSESEFFAQGHFDKPVEWNPDEHTKKNDTPELEKSDGE